MPIPNMPTLQASGAALSQDQVARLKNLQYVQSIRRPPQWKQGSTPYGVNKALAAPDPSDALKPDQRFLEPGPSAEVRPEPKPEVL